MLIGVILMYLQKQQKIRFLIFLTTLFLSMSGGSRSAVYTLICLGSVILLTPAFKTLQIERIVHGLAFYGALLVSLFPFYSNNNDSAFTSRGVLWRNAKSAIQRSPIIGNGQSYWTHQFSQGGFVANYGTHNIWMDNLVAFGAVGAAIFVIIIFGIYKTCEESEFKVLLSVVFILGASESSFQLWKLSGGVPFFLVLVILCEIPKLNSMGKPNASRIAGQE